MGKRPLSWILLLLLLPIPALAALGQNETIFPPLPGDAPDITSECAIEVSSQSSAVPALTDRDMHTYWEGRANSKRLTITSPQKMYGLYICWAQTPKDWRLSQAADGEVIDTSLDAVGIQHQYVPLQGATKVQLMPGEGRNNWFGVRELYVFGEGDVPRFVQRWQMPDETCDLMLFTAHPDDEALFFGGLLPTYAGEMKKDVVVSLFSPVGNIRTSELLNALWLAGVTNYPVLGPFRDFNSRSLERAYQQFDKATVYSYVTGMLRRYKPNVLITHDRAGEYGHGMHSICADSAMKAFDFAADPKRYPSSAKQYGAFQVQKLYLHLLADNPLIMDWDRPLPSFGGMTGFEAAQAAYGEHQSQHRYTQFQVEPFLSDYSSYHFGLYKTMVGPDVYKNDFLENTASALNP